MSPRESQIERIVQAMVPELRKALLEMDAKQQAVHAFDCIDGRSSTTGVHTKFVCIIASVKCRNNAEHAAKQGTS